MARHPVPPGEIPEEMIRERAYHLWEREGRPEGRADDHWQRARSELAIQMDPAQATLRMRVNSPAFRSGDAIPPIYTCEGEDLSPPLEWRGEPQDTRSFLVYCEDPDAPKGTFHHWVAYDIPPERHQLEEGAARGPLHQGINDFGQRGYGGPCPPPRHGIHHYHFRLCALSTDRLPVTHEASVPDIVEAARPYMLAEAEIVGEYSRS